ncbi:hypothetical protein CB1_090937001 [Camelus ferus]|nr:hypothetical protein CB1_090937001 [Camelus ferus]
MGAAGLFGVFLALIAPGVLGQCKFPPSYPFAKPKVQSDQSEFAVGTIWEYECLPGYKKKSFSITCLKTSKWSNTQQFCERKSCMNPRELLHGSVLAPRGFMFGSTITYSCDKGYRLIGDSSATCIISDNAVVWDKGMPFCESIPCESPPAISNGDFYTSNRENFYYGMVVTYKCHVGQNGKKLFDLVVKCPIPEVENGIMESGFRPSFFLSDSVMFKCKPGFTMKGSNIARCQPNSTWNPPLPKCFKGCLPPPHIHHGNYKNMDKELFLIGQEVSYSCEPGYTLIGTNTMQCTSLGTWSHTAPKCEVKSCDAIPKQLLNGRVVAPPNLQLGAKVSFVCNKGYRLNGQSSSQCVSEGMRVLWNNKFPVCERISCDPPPLVKNGRNSYYSGPAPLNTVVSCEPGYLLLGEKTIRCLSSGVWSAVTPTCKEALCEPPGQLLNGQIKRPTSFRVGVTVDFSCNEGYQLHGQPSSQCVIVGQNTFWTKMPVCEEILCPPPPPILNGRHSGSSSVNVPYGSTVTYFCDPSPEKGVNFILIGDSTIRCTNGSQKTGIWSSPAPRCELSIPEAHCPPPQILRGKILSGQKDQYSYNDTVVFACVSGFKMKGSKEIRCDAQGTWEPSVPVCEKDCQAPPRILHGQTKDRHMIHFGPGTSIRYSCDPGYVLAGEESCSHVHIANGYKIFGKEAPYFYNDTVTFKCDNGFTLNGRSQVRCKANNTWDPELPVCEKEAPCQPLKEDLRELPVDASVVPVNTSCQDGYQLTGYAYWKCQDDKNGVWFKKSPLCKEVNCSFPEHINGIQNGLEPGKMYQYGAVVTLECEDGYTLEGSPQSQCQEDHRWNPPLAVCKSPSRCKAPVHPPFAIPTELIDKDEFPIRTSVNFKCLPGYHSYFKRVFSIICQGNSIWSRPKYSCNHK